MMYNEPDIRIQKSDGIAFMTLARPPVNAFNRSMYDQVRRTFQALGDDPEVNVILLTGQGRVFCGGNDLNDFVGFTFDIATEHLAHVRLCLNAMYDCPVPIVGAINGAAVGTGFTLAGLCDIRVSAASAVYALPEVDVGVLGGARHTMRWASQGMTRLLMYTGRRITAERAFQACMVEEVVPDDQLMERATALAREIASKDRHILRLAKEGLNRCESMNLKEGYEYECTLTASLQKSPEAGKAAEEMLAKLSKAK